MSSSINGSRWGKDNHDMTIAAHTLGCKLNFAETSHIVASFADAGWQQVDFDAVADLYLINTCTVTAISERKCRNAIRQAVARNPQAIVAVVGCFAQNDPDAIAHLEGVSLILGNDQKHHLLQHVEQLMAQRAGAHPMPGPAAARPQAPADFQLAYSHADRTRTFFKIQDGCDYFCSYCAIPFARGRSRSASVADTVAMTRHIAATGTKEVVLTGVNTGTFGQGNGESLLQLLQELDTIDGIERYRISSIEPNLLIPDIIDFVATSRHFLPHFHIPLQAGSDAVLRLMRRRYNTHFYSALLHHIKEVMPDACIAADIMAGFNGETDDEFAKVLDYVESLPISYLHVFTFSERPRTAALSMGQRIPMLHRREHSRQLQALSDRKKQAFYQSQLGKERPVLWESTIKNGLMYGFTDNYIRVSRPADPALINTITPFIISTLSEEQEYL